MKRLVLSLLCLLAAASCAAGQTVTMPPEVKVPVGRLAVVTVKWDGDDFQYIPFGDMDCFREYDPDPKTVVLRLIAYAPGRYELAAVAAKNGKMAKPVKCVVIVGEPAPKPPPGPAPNPDPGPKPPPNPDALGFVALSFAEAGKVPVEHRRHAKALADNFEAVSAQLAANLSMTVDEANALLKEKNRATLGASLEPWRPWFVTWQQHMDRHNKEGRVGREHYVQAYKDTAAGLRPAAP